jgi:hypothetical protein
VPVEVQPNPCGVLAGIRPALAGRHFALGAANSRPFDISHDGKRFVFAKPATDAARPTIHVVTNWLQELTAKVGAPHD